MSFIPYCSLYGTQTVQIRYFRNHAGLFEVTANGISIVVFPAQMRRTLKIDPRTFEDCAEITGYQAAQIGFTVPRRSQRGQRKAAV